MRRTVVLIVLDGWGIGREDESNAIYMAKPESFALIKENFPVTSLQASGISVGLPWGEVGNSEVGHLTLGAGKVLYQYFPKITMAIRDGSFFENTALKEAFAHAKRNNSAVNLVGLLSRGNVHASLDHILALIEMGNKEKVPVKLHLMSDGKDSPPFTLERFLGELPLELLSTLIGRYYGMDREGNWQLTAQAYGTLVGEGGELIQNNEELKAAIAANYERGNNEEFLPPLSFGKEKGIRDGEAIIFFNYREDSIRQLSEAFTMPGFDKFPTKAFENLFVATMTQYEESSLAPVAFLHETIGRPLGMVLSEHKKTQLRIAETYKYAHVTYFFNGYEEKPFENEYRVLIPSLNVLHIEKHPQMMAAAITDRLIQAIENQSFDFILVNYANGDTIAHTGNYEATIEAARTIDREIMRIIKTVEGTPTFLAITSDHGNAEETINPLTALPETQHDPNPVPFYLVGSEFKKKKFVNFSNLSQPVGILADVAPTILELLGVPKPEEMTGQSLLRHLLA